MGHCSDTDEKQLQHNRLRSSGQCCTLAKASEGGKMRTESSLDLAMGRSLEALSGGDH